jgi:hypothetical protein
MFKEEKVGTFATKWLARLYRWWNYSWADPAWKGTFRWDIEPI